MRKTSCDQKRASVRTFQTQLPVWVNFWASARYASLRRRACSTRLRSVMSSDSAIMNCGTLSVPGTRETLLLTQIELSSFSLQQLGDERPVGFVVVLMRYVQKTKCTQFLLRVTHDCLVDMIGG